MDELLRFVLLRDANTVYVVAGTVLLGIASGLVGTFALLRRESLVGDALAHAALPGVCAGFLLAGERRLAALLGGALLAGWLGTQAIALIQRRSKLKDDAAIGIVLSVFFALGMVLLTYIQTLPTGAQAGLDKYLFGSAASLVGRDVAVIGAVAALAAGAVALLYKEFKLLCFDAGLSASLGFPRGLLEAVLMTLLALTVVAGLQTVGAVLISALLIAPAAAARLWTDRLPVMLALAAAFGAASGYVGALFSSLGGSLPTGPLVVLSAAGIFCVSLVVAPERGLAARLLRRRRTNARIRGENALKHIFLIEEHLANPALVSGEDVAAHHSVGVRDALAMLEGLRRRGWVERDGAAWSLTPEGSTEARRIVASHRVWETYLARELALPPDHLHRDAEDMEHVIDRDMLGRLDEELGHPARDPHGTRIPRPEERP
ncbi:MAG: metal ABC transporter permease [Candidatus Sumerlaeia bacterium]|nr:metal ABC transporter permease [Candidatus Sumerlaeia bacterium]